jgi:hypothetical protein
METTNIIFPIDRYYDMADYWGTIDTMIVMEWMTHERWQEMKRYCGDDANKISSDNLQMLYGLGPYYEEPLFTDNTLEKQLEQFTKISTYEEYLDWGRKLNSLLKRKEDKKLFVHHMLRSTECKALSWGCGWAYKLQEDI